MVVRQAMETAALTKRQETELEVADMKMLRISLGAIERDRN